MKIIEAEENALIDFQFLVQELILEKGMSRASLAERAGISKARLSQLFGSDANPTAKTFARVLHALGEEIALTTKRRLSSCPAQTNEWTWEKPPIEFADRPVSSRKRAQFVAAVREAASNDNYSSQVYFLDEGEKWQTLNAA